MPRLESTSAAPAEARVRWSPRTTTAERAPVEIAPGPCWLCGGAEDPRRRRVEASASCQKLTGALPLPVCPSLFQTGTGLETGPPAKHEELADGKARLPITSEGRVPLQSPAEFSWVSQCLTSCGSGVLELPRSRGQGSSERRGCSGNGSERNRSTGTLSSKGRAQLLTRKRNKPTWGPQPAPLSGPWAIQPLPAIPGSTSRDAGPDVTVPGNE